MCKKAPQRISYGNPSDRIILYKGSVVVVVGVVAAALLLLLFKNPPSLGPCRGPYEVISNSVRHISC